MSPTQLIDMIVEGTKEIFPLKFRMDWNNNHERVVFNTQGEFFCTLKVNSDWGAMLSLVCQNAVNQAIPLREYQLINISTRAEKILILENGRTVLLHENIDFHLWGQHGLTLSSDCFVTYHSLRRVMLFHEKKGDRVWVLQLFTDQCAAEYKSRLTAMGLLMLALEFNLLAVYQAYSATSDGKGAHDGSAGAGAAVSRGLMKTGAEIYNCAWDTFLVISEKMGQPNVPEDKSRLPHGLTKRVHYFFIDEKDVVAYERNPLYAARAAQMRARSGPAGDVMILNSSHQNKWDATPVNGIMSISQLVVLKKDPSKRLLLTEALEISKQIDDECTASSPVPSIVQSSSPIKMHDAAENISRSTRTSLDFNDTALEDDNEFMHPTSISMSESCPTIAMETESSRSSLEINVNEDDDDASIGMIGSPERALAGWPYDLMKVCGKSSSVTSFGRSDPTNEYSLFSRKFPCPCSSCRNLDFSNCRHIDQVGALSLEEISYVPAKAPPPQTEEVEEAYNFFDGPISSNEEARLLVLRPSGEDEFLIAIMNSPPKRIDKKTVQDIPARGAEAAEQVVWNPGDVQIKAKILTPYVDANGNQNGYFCAVNTPVQTLNIKCLILPPNHLAADVTRENYLAFQKIRTQMRRNNKSEYRDVFVLSVESKGMINEILGR